jgi:glycosyltransferase involved in cell wall biosynthesis
MNLTPKVSIIIPVYNGSNFLDESIDSALSQTYKKTEVIVVNDGSNDNGMTEKVAKSYRNQIRYFRKNNGGVASALNYGIKKMKGLFFSWLSHDDIYYPHKIQKQIEYLNKINKFSIILYSDFEIINEKSQYVRIVKVPPLGMNSIRYHLTRYSAINGCTLLIPRLGLLKSGGFNTKLRATQDYDMWYRLSKYYNYIHHPEVLVKTRIHASQVGVRDKHDALIEGNKLKIKFLQNLSSSDYYGFDITNGSSTYLECAKGFHRGGLYDARDYAIQLCKTNSKALSLFQKLKLRKNELFLKLEIANIFPYYIILLFKNSINFFSRKKILNTKIKTLNI